MKSIRIFLVCTILSLAGLTNAQVGVDNTTPDPSSVLDLASTDKGVLIPRMTSTQRQAITSPATSLLVFDTTIGKFYYFNGTAWNILESWNTITNGISYTGQVAVNTTTPNTSAAFDLTSTTKGVLISRMTSTERLAIASPATSLLVFDTTLGKYYYYTGTVWTALDSWNAISGGVSYTGQVAVNTTSPNVSATVDMTSTTQGILIPRMTSTQRQAITSPATSLLVFDITEGVFYFYTGSQWASLNSFVQHAGNTTATHNGDVVVNGSITATSYVGLNVTGTVPAGGIIMWSGTVANIPSGWALCDGNNSTPDLRERFIVGAGGDNNLVDGGPDFPNGYTAGAGNTGGKTQVSLTITDLPSHKHNYKDRFAIENAGITTWPTGYQVESAGSNKRGNQTDTDNDEYIYLNKETDYTGGGGAHENRPPFYALAFIMKL